MEFFKGAKVVKLRSHLEKFLIADGDRETVRQSRTGSTGSRARWAVEFPPDEGSGGGGGYSSSTAIRLRSCHTGRYLTASDAPLLLGATGKKVMQSELATKWDPRVDWVPVRDGFQVKLRAAAAGAAEDGGDYNYLRANGGPPPWRNSVTHDRAHAVKKGHRWALWDVEEASDDDGGDDINSIFSESPTISSLPSTPSFEVQQTKDHFAVGRTARAMDLFRNAKAVRLRSHHDKYLTAEEDEESVTQDRNGSSKKARWTVEFDSSSSCVAIRLRSCCGKYLTASNQPFLLGMTGCKVTQTHPRPGGANSSLDWIPIRDGTLLKLRTRYNNYLRANGGLPPWRNSVTHDVPHRTSTQDWILWEVDILEILQSDHQLPIHNPPSLPSTHHRSPSSPSFSRQESVDSISTEGSSPPKVDGRMIHYRVVYDDEGGGGDAGDGEEVDECCFTFKGNGVEELSRRLEEETGLDGIIVCTRSPLNGKLYPLRLQLPPNNATMHLLVVPSSSKVSREFSK